MLNVSDYVIILATIARLYGSKARAYLHRRRALERKSPLIGNAVVAFSTGVRTQFGCPLPIAFVEETFRSERRFLS
jgi:hypothetical protein